MIQFNKTVCCLLALTISSSLIFLIYSRERNDNFVTIKATHRNVQFANGSEQEVGKLFNVKFKYLINNDVCGDADIRAVILVTSFAGNVETRSAMRRAFSKAALMAAKMRRIFLVADGSSSKYSVSQKALLNENNRFGDLVQGNFLEAYRNLTYKHVMGMRWVSERCKNARYVIKMDDDMVVNMYKLTEFIKTFRLPPGAPIAGYVLHDKPRRETQNKWYVTKEEFSDSVYPPYVSGWFYITTPEVYSNMTKLVHQVSYFFIDDVYVTGILAKLLNIRHTDISMHFTLQPEIINCCIRDVKDRRLDCNFLIGPNGGDNNLFYDFNRAYAKCVEKPCKKRSNRKIYDSCFTTKTVEIGKGSGSVSTYSLI